MTDSLQKGSAVSSPPGPAPDEHGGRRTHRRTIALHGEQVSFWDSTPTREAQSAGHPAGEAQPPSPCTGEVVVLVHGFAGSAHTWEPVLAELARRRDPRHIIIPDLVGHGSSAAPWADYSLGGYATGIRDLLAALGHDHVTIVGHSLGGGVVQQFIWQFPQHCARLVLVDTGGLGREVSPVMRAATLPGADVVLPLLTDRRVVGAVETLSHWARGVLPQLPGSTREAARSFASLADPVHRRAFLHTARSVIDWGGQRVSATTRLYLLEGLPTLIVWGSEDTMIPVSHAHRAHRLIPGSRLELLDGAGHFPHCDQPERFTDLLTEFLDHTLPAQRTAAEQGARIAAGATSPTPSEPGPGTEHRQQEPGPG